MKKYICICIASLFFIVHNVTYAQGPNVPEAAAFEPIDATDMVNLVTGDFTYVLPVINIPGPNGGYPLSLSYHAGIAMDQESSWVGLGWSLNPGAINRNVNGYPDDWDNVKTYEYYWNKGETQRQHTIDVSIPIYNVTIGLGRSWGSMRGSSGSVSLNVNGLNFKYSSAGEVTIGAGVDNVGASTTLSINGNSSISAGFSTGGQYGATLGVSYSEGGGFSGSVGVYAASVDPESNKSGVNGSLGLTTNGAITYGLGASIAYTDNKGRSGKISRNKNGAYSNSFLLKDEISIDQKGYSTIALPVNYTYERVKWWVDILKEPGISGALYADNIALKVPQGVIDFCEEKYGRCLDLEHSNIACECIESEGEDYGYTGETDTDYAFSDIYELNNGSPNWFPWPNNKIHNPNPALLNFDGYNVAAQGLAGTMTPKFMKNIALINKNDDFEEGTLDYYRPEDYLANQTKANFYFDNELVSGTILNKINFSNPSNPSKFQDYILNPGEVTTGIKEAGSFVEYFTFGEELPIDVIVPKYFEKPNYADSNSIAGFRVTSTDGMVYTYMLPVYNMMDKFRSFLTSKNDPDQYFERTSKAYATHWLLTSVTGPDYVDVNTNGVLDDKDYGYWVSFEYGKWSEGMVWRIPAKLNEYSLRGRNSQYHWGTKEIYYLDKISTRTHSALFVKELREDSQGVPQPFHYIDQSTNTMPIQKLLRLKQILLLKNTQLGAINKNNTTNIVPSPNRSYSFSDPKINHTYNLKLNFQDNVIDSKDSFISDLRAKSLNIVDFEYDYSLVHNAPNSSQNGRLTLKKLTTRGKKGITLIPPYEFSYNHNPEWDYLSRNYWGYKYRDATAWSLNQIKTPIGATINIDYESDVFDNDKPTNPDTGRQSYIFDKYRIFPAAGNNNIIAEINVGHYDLDLGDIIYVGYDYEYQDCAQGATIYAHYYGPVILKKRTYGRSHIGNTVFDCEMLEPENHIYEFVNYFPPRADCPTIKHTAHFSGNKQKKHAGIRVASIGVSDGINTLKTTYEYGTGSVPYEPFFYKTQAENQQVLRSPNVLYDKVTVKNLDHNNQVVDSVRTVYEFFTEKTLMSFDEESAKLRVTADSRSLGLHPNQRETVGVTYEYKDYQGIIGNLKRKSIYQGNRLLSRTTNNYSFLDESSGLINTESTQMIKSIDGRPATPYYLGFDETNYIISTKYTTYPVVLESSETIQGGFKTVEYTSKNRDPKSGELLETFLIASDGKEYKTEITPAYHIDAYQEMGSKKDNPANKNMLSQQVMSKSFIKENGQWELTSAEIETWKPQSYQDHQNNSFSVWRKHKNFTWSGEINDQGIIQGYEGLYDSFNWQLGVTQSADSEWRQNSEVTRYDEYSLPLEVIDINGNALTTKTGDNKTKVFCTGNASYDEIFYSGAEDLNGNLFGGDVKKGTATISNDSHTGNRSLKVANGQTAFEVVVKNNKTTKYKISLWVKKDTYQHTRLKVGSNTVEFEESEKVPAGDWIMLNFYATISNGQKTYITASGGNIIVDDFRLHPEYASMTSYVYNHWDELTNIIGSNNLASHYIYDDAGRLTCTFTEVPDTDTLGGGFKLVSNNKYKYQGISTDHSCVILKEDAGFELEIYEGGQISIWPTMYLDVRIAEKTFAQNYPNVGPDPVKKWEIDYGDGTVVTGTGRVHPAPTIDNSVMEHVYTTSPGPKTITIKAYNDKNQVQVYKKTINLGLQPHVTNINSRPHARSTTFDISGAPGSWFKFKLTTYYNGSLILTKSSETLNYDVDVNQNNGEFTSRSIQIPANGKIEAELYHRSSSSSEASNYQYTAFEIIEPEYQGLPNGVSDRNITTN